MMTSRPKLGADENCFYRIALGMNPFPKKTYQVFQNKLKTLITAIAVVQNVTGLLELVSIDHNVNIAKE